MNWLYPLLGVNRKAMYDYIAARRTGNVITIFHDEVAHLGVVGRLLYKLNHK